MSHLYIAVAFFSRGLDPDFDHWQMCEVCGFRKAVDVDHIYGRMGPLMYDPRFLMLVCRKCHSDKTGSSEKARRAAIVELRLKPVMKDLYLFVLYQFYGNYDTDPTWLYKVQDLSIKSLPSTEDTEGEENIDEDPEESLRRILGEIPKQGHL